MSLFVILLTKYILKNLAQMFFSLWFVNPLLVCHPKFPELSFAGESASWNGTYPQYDSGAVGKMRQEFTQPPWNPGATDDKNVIREPAG